jgi:N-acetylmuramoyl-L-alanine amidase
VPAAEACNGVDDNCDGLTDPPGTCAPIVVRKVCLDPGHGGTDPGAVGFVHEAPMNLDIGLRLRDLLAGDTRDASGGASWGVFMTRDSDSAVSLESRVDYANASQVDRFVSIHNNAGGGTGTETYWYTSGSAQSGNLAGKVQARVVSYVGTRDRGVKQAGYYVIRYTVMPAVLVEVAFVDTRSDADILEDPVRRQAAARGMLHGLQEHFGVPVHDPVQDLPQRGPS